MTSLNRSLLAGVMTCAVASYPVPLQAQVGTASSGVPLRIYGLGDIGEAGSILNRSAEILHRAIVGEASGDDALVYLGDNFYPNGLQGGNEAKNQSRIRKVLDLSGLRAAQSALAPNRIFSVAGNHEYYNHLLFGRFPLGFSEAGDGVGKRAPDLGWRYSGGRSDVAYLTGPDGVRVALFLLDSAIATAGTPMRIQEIMGSFEKALRDSADRADWRLLAMHHPLETRGDHGHSFDRREEHGWIRRHSFPHKLDTCSRTFQRFVAQLSAHISSSGVPIDLVMSGHDHNFQVLGLESRAPGWPRVQVVSGSASKVNDTKRRLAPGEYFAASSGFAELQVTMARIEVSFRSTATPCLHGGETHSTGFARFEMVKGGTLKGISPCTPRETRAAGRGALDSGSEYHR